jgi:integrase
MQTATRWQGVSVRHKTGCRAPQARCSCSPSYIGQVYDRTTGKRIYSRSMASGEAAAAWRVDTLAALRARPAGLIAEALTVGEGSKRFLEAAESGLARNRQGRSYKREAVRDYRGMFDRHWKDFEDVPMADLRRSDVQAMIDAMLGRGLSGSTVRGAVTALRALWRWARARDLVVADGPFGGLQMPANDEVPRDRIPGPDELAGLIGVLPVSDRAPFALAAYATGRRQEIRHLKWTDVDLKAGRIRWAGNPEARKTPNAQRLVPIVAPLRAILEELPHTSEYVVPGKRGGMFSAEALLTRSRKVWEAAGTEPIGLHDCRHCAASYLIASGANLKALSVLMGHGSVSITADRYGHMLPGGEDEVGKLFDAFLERSKSAQAV